MRQFVRLIAVAAFVAAAGCVTINVYFPAAAAEQAAQRFIGKVIGDEPAPASSTAEPPSAPASSGGGMAALLDFVIPAAHAQSPDLKVSTPRIVALRAGMRARFHAEIRGLLDSGAAGFTRDGMVALRDASVVPLAQRNQVRRSIDDENRDRAEVYGEIARANGHPEWEKQIRETFAREWVQQARDGWYYQDASGAWKRK